MTIADKNEENPATRGGALTAIFTGSPGKKRKLNADDSPTRL